MADIVHRITEITHTRLSLFGCSDDDAYNRLNHRHTVLMLLIFSAVLTSRLFISDLIICWTPGEFTGKYDYIFVTDRLIKLKGKELSDCCLYVSRDKQKYLSRQ
jgi:hypothetical protein